VNRGFVETGLAIGGLPQSGGHTTTASGGVIAAASPTDEAITTAAPNPTIASSRTVDVARTAGATYDESGVE
jgi:hypothetical protein